MDLILQSVVKCLGSLKDYSENSILVKRIKCYTKIFTLLNSIHSHILLLLYSVHIIKINIGWCENNTWFYNAPYFPSILCIEFNSSGLNRVPFYSLF